jgi:hypothetical protein
MDPVKTPGDWRTLRRYLPQLCAGESGFTVIELIMTAVILAIISAPISGVLLAAAANSKAARERTASDQFLATKVEALRTIPYTQVGIVGGNPSGLLPAATTATLPNGTGVTITSKVTFVNDPIPTAYVTNADYKKVVLTVTRTSDGKELSSVTTYVASASAPPLAGTGWVQIKRTIVDAVTTSPLPGADIDVTGGPSSVSRGDTADGAGVVLFPALDSASSGTPVYAIDATLTGYSEYPDDLAPQLPEQVGSSPGLVSNATIRMYQPVTLTVNVQTSSGAAYTSGATVSLASSRCGVATVSIPAGQSSTTFTTCQWANGKTISLVPNVLGQTPSFDTYNATAWSNSGGFWGTPTAFTVPSAYPTTLSKTVNVKFSSTTYATTKTVNVNVKRGGSNDGNARVVLTGGPAGVALYGVTNSSGNASFTIPVNATASTFTVAANEQGVASGSTTFQASTSTTSPIAVNMTIS